LAGGTQQKYHRGSEALTPLRLPAVRVSQRILVTALREQGSASLVESKYIVEGRVHRGFQGGGAKEVPHSGQLLVVDFDRPLGRIIQDVRSEGHRYPDAPVIDHPVGVVSRDQRPSPDRRS
jgi:hypothetical protein